MLSIEDRHAQAVAVAKEHIDAYLEFQRNALAKRILSTTDTKETMTLKSVYEHVGRLINDLENGE
ncbi:hypothetical protein [Vibrio lentus]|uniref:hypothetical protein n=1 Tax=Vibrio lentus TaxID=136468 RepID=UPI0010BD7247|nr:hypothetical protein [Vibrio lentus]TKG17745.1 hypothetical protein FCW05_12625 [Vibrio lentus]